MLVAYFPYFTYAVPAVAGLCVMAALIEYGVKWSVLTYICSSFLAFLFAEIESKMIFIAFFGFYPILKCIIEKINKPIAEWILKIAVFNVCIITLYTIFSKLLTFDMTEFGEFAKYGVIGLLVVANGVFVVYDLALSRLAQYYLYKIHPQILKFLK